MGKIRLLQGRIRYKQIRSILYPAAAAQRDRHAAHGTWFQPDPDGRADPLSPHEGRQHAVATGYRPRGDRDTDRRGAPARRARDFTPRSRPREIHRKSLGVEEVLRRHHHAPDAPPRHLARLVARTLHDGRRSVQVRERNIRAPVQRRPDLSRKTAGKLGSQTPHRRIRSRGGAGGRRRLHVAHPLSADRKRQHAWIDAPQRRHYPSRDHAGRRRGDGASGGFPSSPTNMWTGNSAPAW
jgi:hypothetical protein